MTIYHFSQQNKTASYLFEPYGYQLPGWHNIGWDMQGGVTATVNHSILSLNTNNPAYNPANDDWCSIQAQQYWSAPVAAWDWSINGYNTKVEIGVSCSVTQSTGAGLNYATLYILMENMQNNNQFWVQAALMYEDGPYDDYFYFDPLTGQSAYSFCIGASDYITTEVDSHTLKTGTFTDSWYGFDFTRQDVYDLIGARNAALGLNDTQEPGWWHIRAAGVNPEIGNADLGGQMTFTEHDLFVRSV